MIYNIYNAITEARKEKSYSYIFVKKKDTKDSNKLQFDQPRQS